jgi:adenylosuccinate synthase
MPASLTPLSSFKNIVFENGQGLLLDQDLTFYGNNTTPSSTGSKNAIATINKYFSKATENVNVELCYVTRTYMTRHGVGRFETECDKAAINAAMVDETNVTNQFQDNLRYGELIIPNLVARVNADIIQAKNSIWNTSHINLTSNIAVTHTNEYQLDYSQLRDKLVSGVYVSDSRVRDSVKIFTEF